MKKNTVKVMALVALLTLGASKGFAQEEDEVMIEDDSAETSFPVETEEEAPVPAEDESFEYSEEEY